MSHQTYHAYDGSGYVRTYIATPARMQAILTANGWTAGNAPTPAQLIERQRGIMALSFSQLMIGLVTEGWITEAEGEAWLAGTLPTAVTTLIGTLPAAQRFPARARAQRPSVVLRNDPLVAALGAAESKTAAEIDTFFTTYAQV